MGGVDDTGFVTSVFNFFLIVQFRHDEKAFVNGTILYRDFNENTKYVWNIRRGNKIINTLFWICLGCNFYK